MLFICQYSQLFLKSCCYLVNNNRIQLRNCFFHSTCNTLCIIKKYYKHILYAFCSVTPNMASTPKKITPMLIMVYGVDSIHICITINIHVTTSHKIVRYCMQDFKRRSSTTFLNSIKITSTELTSKKPVPIFLRHLKMFFLFLF